MIRFGKSTQNTSKNPKKPDNLEILTLLDNCTLIFKDDRITLRNMVKEGNADVIAILNHYKRNTNHKELSTDLRKYLRKKGDKENEKVVTCQSPTSNRYLKQQPQQAQLQPLANSQKKSCPDLWKPAEPISPKKTINLARTKELVNDVQLSEIILSDRNNNESKDIEKTKLETNISHHYPLQLITNIDPSKEDSKTIQQNSQLQNSNQQQILEQDVEIIDDEDDEDMQSDSSNESILKQITQPPHLQNITPKNDIRPTQLFQSGHSSYLQINTAQSYLQPILVQQSYTQPPQKETIQVQDTQKHYSFFNYQDYQFLAQPQYQHLFTHWPSLLHKLDKPEYVPNYRAALYLNTTPEHIFSILFPSSSHIRINYFTFKNHLKCYQLQVDPDQLFKELDQDHDDWINYRDTGLLLDGLCMHTEQPKNCVKVIFETLKQSQTIPNTLSIGDLEQFEQKTDFLFARQLMQEVDIQQKGFLTYWDLYMHREIYLMERLCQIVQSLTGGSHTHY